MLTSYPSLPQLSDDELVASFGSDPDGIRRYHILHAVLVRGVSQREAAQAAGVSERTVRNVLQLYRREGGIDRLFSRASAPRRISPQRASLYEPALAAALVEDPTAGGDRLLRRACEILGEDAAGLSRRTAYRILARLRAEREREADQSEEISVVRSALTLVIEDPPLSLGATPLAQKLLPDENDALLRGTLLKQTLRSAIDRLRPNGEISAIDRDWWPYLICSGEYEAGQSRAELQEDLALSPSTYSRAKRQGLSQVAATLPHIVSSLSESHQARVNQLLPRTADFLGRRDEESFYAWRLQTEGMAHLWGLPGSGKTALAAELAAEGRRYGQSIVWHTCDSTTNARLSGIVQGLLSNMTSRDELSFAEMSLDGMLEELRERLLVRPTVVIIDDVHRVDREESAPLFGMLGSLVERGAIRLLLVGQHPPQGSGWSPLPGLSEREARMLWVDLPPLPEAQWNALYAATAGFPQPLRRVVAAYRRAGAHARPSDWRQHVIDWANEAIWQGLSEPEQTLLAVAYGLEPHQWSSQRQHVLDAIGVDDRTLGALCQRGLLSNGDQYLCVHPALALVAEAAFEANDTLRDLCEHVIANAVAPAAPAAELPLIRADVVQSKEIEPPAGLALLDRLRLVLERSAAYLEQDEDQTARHLAAELAALQAALPGPAWLRR